MGPDHKHALDRMQLNGGPDEGRSQIKYQHIALTESQTTMPKRSCEPDKANPDPIEPKRARTEDTTTRAHQWLRCSVVKDKYGTLSTREIRVRSAATLKSFANHAKDLYAKMDPSKKRPRQVTFICGGIQWDACTKMSDLPSENALFIHGTNSVLWM